MFQPKALLATFAPTMLTAALAASPALAGARDLIITTAPARSAERVLEIPQACDPRTSICTEPEIEWHVESVIYAETAKQESAERAKPEEAAETAARSGNSTPDETIEEYQAEQVTAATIGATAPARARAESPRAGLGPGSVAAYPPSMAAPSRKTSVPPGAATVNPSYLLPPVGPFLPR